MDFNRHDIRRIARITGMSAASLVAAITQASGAPPRELIYPERPSLILPDSALSLEERGLLHKLAIIPGLGFVPAFGGGGAAPPSVMSSQRVNGGGANDVWFTKPTGLQDGDYVICFVSSNGGGVTPPSGWTARTMDPTYGLQAFTRTALAADTNSNYQFTIGSALPPFNCALIHLRGVASFDVGVSNSTSFGSYSLSSYTASASGLTVLFAGDASKSGTYTMAGGWTDAQTGSGIYLGSRVDPAGTIASQTINPSVGPAAAISLHVI